MYENPYMGNQFMQQIPRYNGMQYQQMQQPVYQNPVQQSPTQQRKYMRNRREISLKKTLIYLISSQIWENVHRKSLTLLIATRWINK